MRVREVSEVLTGSVPFLREAQVKGTESGVSCGHQQRAAAPTESLRAQPAEEPGSRGPQVRLAIRNSRGGGQGGVQLVQG